MSIIQIKGRTTNSEPDFDAYSLSSNSCIFTTATEPNIEEFSIELTLGDGWNDNYSTQDRSLRHIDESLVIRGHGSVVVEVQEEIRVPHNRYGVVLPTGSLFLSRGILIASAKVEPAFVGKLKLRIFNTTDQKICLKRGEKLGSVIFFSTESTKLHKKIYKASDISLPPVSRLKEAKKWLATNKTVWVGWGISIVTSSLITFFATYFLFYKPMLEIQKTSSNKIQQNQQNQQNQQAKQTQK